MARAEEHVRVVVVSPGDVVRERVVAQAVVDELNRGVARDRGCRLSLWRWEIDARPGMHLDGSQGLIDELMGIQDADVVVACSGSALARRPARRTRGPSTSCVVLGLRGSSGGARR